MRHFLLKVDSSACPNRNNWPVRPGDWESGDFISGTPRSIKDGTLLPQELRRSPDPGDQIAIWINGRGLMATARVAEYGTRERRIRLSDLTLLPEPRLGDQDLKRVPRNSGDVLDDINRNRRSSLRALDGSSWDELMAAARDKEASSSIRQPTPRPHENLRAEPDPEQERALQIERERTWRLIEERAGQGPFRDGLIRRDGARCAVTRCPVLRVVEAGHLKPFAEHRGDRENLGNGILLRADIHTLFDRGLMSIDPETRELWIADMLTGTSYERFHVPGRKIKTGAGEEYLRYHFDWARKRSE